MFDQSRGHSLIRVAAMLLASILVAALAYWGIAIVQNAPARSIRLIRHRATPTPVHTLSVFTPTIVAPPLSTVDTTTVLGVSGRMQFAGISWESIAYATCGSDGLSGTALQNAVNADHSSGAHVLLLLCQGANSGPQLFAAQQFDDVAQAGADAVQCGDQQMRQGNQPATSVVPADFAHFYDLCASAVHKIQPNVPALLGSLDPLAGGVDQARLKQQVSYLDQVQSAMNSSVHPGGNWQWRQQTIGLIDNWHDGYPNEYTNSLASLFAFWAQQFGVNTQSSALGQHLWVVEGSGCFQDCGLDPGNAYQVAVAHILTLITDVQTSLNYKVPFFYFSVQDFTRNGVLWPTGILDLNGNPKPLRQDLPMGARTLVMNCANAQQSVTDQEQLLIDLYQGCTLPADYATTLNN